MWTVQMERTVIDLVNTDLDGQDDIKDHPDQPWSHLPNFPEI